MRQRKKIRKANPTFAVVVDGPTEAWYLQMLKRNEREIRVSIKPEIPQKKSLQEQYEFVCGLSKQEFTKVFWVIDIDTIISETNQAPKGKQKPLEKFMNLRKEVMEACANVVVIVNNPCLEFWFLLHFISSPPPYFKNCNAAEQLLKKHVEGYTKSEKFFKKQDNDIYLQLKPYLKTALKHSATLNFDSQNPTRSMCEMSLFFQSDELKEYFKTELSTGDV